MQVAALIESLQLHRGPALAFALALGLALAARGLRLAIPAGLAGGLGILAGWWLTFGLLTASPRQLPERLPLLALLMLLLAALLLPPARRWPRLALPAALLGPLAAGWWMAGAPLVLPDLLRAAPTLGGVAAASLLLAMCGGARWSGAVAAAVLLAGLLLVPLPGPQPLLGAVLLAATLGALAIPSRPDAAGAVAALPVAACVVGLSALPVIARGAPADWLVAAAPLAALAIGAPVGARLGGPAGAGLGAGVIGAGFALFAFLIR